mmetsp:Transcript_59705/g.176917  ORF Transcript_59705/g.176917 Transcript_59705/m.176917 type:complete len:1342 (-) Transcript_59705:293-4318(-)
MDSHNFGHRLPPYRSISSGGESNGSHRSKGSSSVGSNGGNGYPAVGSQRSTSDVLYSLGGGHNHHHHRASHGIAVAAKAPVVPPPGQNIWGRGGGRIPPSIASAAPVDEAADDHVGIMAVAVASSGSGPPSPVQIVRSSSGAPSPTNHPNYVSDASDTDCDDDDVDRSAVDGLPEYRGADRPSPDSLIVPESDVADLSIIAPPPVASNGVAVSASNCPARNLTDAFERMYSCDDEDTNGEMDATHGGCGEAGAGKAPRTPDMASVLKPEDREDVEQTRSRDIDDAKTPSNNGIGGNDGVGPSPAGIDELDVEGQLQHGQQVGCKDGADTGMAARTETRLPPQNAPRKSRPPSSVSTAAASSASSSTVNTVINKSAAAEKGMWPRPHEFNLVPALTLSLPRPVANRVSFYSVLHDINKEVTGMAANDHSNYTRKGEAVASASAGMQGMGIAPSASSDRDENGGEPPKDEEDHPLVVAVNGPPPPKAVDSAESAHSQDGSTVGENPPKSKFVHAALIDEERWLLSAIDSRSPEEIDALRERGCPSTFAEAIGEKETSSGSRGEQEGGGGGGEGRKNNPAGGINNGQTANPLSSLSNSRTQLWKPSRSWWEAKSGKNPWIEPSSHNKRWRYLWPLIHYHKFLARCIKKLKRNGVDVKTSLSPVSAFLRDEVCSVSDHLAAVSKFTSDEWMAALEPFNGWTDRDSCNEKNLRGLMGTLKLRSVEEVGDMDSPLLRSQIDEQFLRVMEAQRQQIASGGLQLTTQADKVPPQQGGRRPPVGQRQMNARYGQYPPPPPPPHQGYGYGMPPMHGRGQRPPVYNSYSAGPPGPPGYGAYGRGQPMPPTGRQNGGRGGGRKSRNRIQDMQQQGGYGYYGAFGHGGHGGARGGGGGGRGGGHEWGHHGHHRGGPHHHHHPSYGYPNGSYGNYGAYGSHGGYYPPAYGHPGQHGHGHLPSQGHHHHGGAHHGASGGYYPQGSGYQHDPGHVHGGHGYPAQPGSYHNSNGTNSTAGNSWGAQPGQQAQPQPQQQQSQLPQQTQPQQQGPSSGPPTPQPHTPQGAPPQPPPTPQGAGPNMSPVTPQVHHQTPEGVPTRTISTPHQDQVHSDVARTIHPDVPVPYALDTSIDAVPGPPPSGDVPPSPFWGHLNLSTMPGLDTPMAPRAPPPQQHHNVNGVEAGFAATPGARRKGGGRGSFAGSDGSGGNGEIIAGGDAADGQWLGLAYQTYHRTDGFAPPSPATQFGQSNAGSGWAHAQAGAYGDNSGNTAFMHQGGYGEFGIQGPMDGQAGLATDSSQLDVSVDVAGPPEVRKITYAGADGVPVVGPSPDVVAGEHTQKAEGGIVSSAVVEVEQQ